MVTPIELDLARVTIKPAFWDVAAQNDEQATIDVQCAVGVHGIACSDDIDFSAVDGDVIRGVQAVIADGNRYGSRVDDD